jgi:hypothetical protein
VAAVRNALLLVTCLFAGFVTPAFGHASSTSYLLVDAPADGKPSLRWEIAVDDLIWNVFVDQDLDQQLSAAEIASGRRAIFLAVNAELSVARGGWPCLLALRDLTPATRDEHGYLAVELDADCPHPGRLEISGSYFLNSPTQRVLLNVTRGADTLTSVLNMASRGWLEPERRSAWQEFLRFVGEGILHVFIGYDHIAFVLLLLLPSVLRSAQGQWQGAERPGEVLRDLVTIVTAFTVAHSTTLALAVTGAMRLPAQPIEVAIAASIVVAAGVNLVPALARLRLRWPSVSAWSMASDSRTC